MSYWYYCYGGGTGEVRQHVRSLVGHSLVARSWVQVLHDRSLLVRVVRQEQEQAMVMDRSRFHLVGHS